jgi:hypothetical protein
MTLDEAIKELQIMNHDGFIITRDTELKAIQLLIEAGKRVKLWRQDNVYPDYALLPGETEE